MISFKNVSALWNLYCSLINVFKKGISGYICPDFVCVNWHRLLLTTNIDLLLKYILNLNNKKSWLFKVLKNGTGTLSSRFLRFFRESYFFFLWLQNMALFSQVDSSVYFDRCTVLLTNQVKNKGSFCKCFQAMAPCGSSMAHLSRSYYSINGLIKQSSYSGTERNYQLSKPRFHHNGHRMLPRKRSSKVPSPWLHDKKLYPMAEEKGHDIEFPCTHLHAISAN